MFRKEKKKNKARKSAGQKGEPSERPSKESASNTEGKRFPPKSDKAASERERAPTKPRGVRPIFMEKQRSNASNDTYDLGSNAAFKPKKISIKSAFQIDENLLEKTGPKLLFLQSDSDSPRPPGFSPFFPPPLASAPHQTTRERSVGARRTKETREGGGRGEGGRGKERDDGSKEPVSSRAPGERERVASSSVKPTSFSSEAREMRRIRYLGPCPRV